jgi:hypothetical protein
MNDLINWTNEMRNIYAIFSYAYVRLFLDSMLIAQALSLS